MNQFVTWLHVERFDACKVRELVDSKMLVQTVSGSRKACEGAGSFAASKQTEHLITRHIRLILLSCMGLSCHFGGALNR